MRTSLRSETDLAAPVLALLKSELFGFEEFAQERVVTLDGQDVSVDLLARKPEVLLAVELKRTLNGESLEQAMRWLKRANLVCIGVEEPHIRSKPHEMRRTQCTRLGIGVVYVSSIGVAEVSIPPVFHDEGVDTRLLEAAMDRSDGACDPVAGSRNAKRNNEARSQWEPATKYLRSIGYGSQYWKSIKRAVPEMRSVTSAQAVKAIDKGEWVGAEYSDTTPTAFWATTGAKA